MAEPVTTGADGAVDPAAPAVVAGSGAPLVRPTHEHPRSYVHRFRAVYVGLGLVFAFSAAVLVLVLANPTTHHTSTWSRWQPAGGSRLQEGSQIAAHVAPEYKRAKGGGEFVAVKAGAPEIQNVPVEAIAVRPTSGSDKDIKIYQPISGSNTLVYQLCGLGSHCAIPGAKSVARAQLMRREALEIALYTFKYVDGVDSVVAQLPPPPDKTSTSWALFFRQDDFKAQLARPLDKTIADVPRIDPTSLKAAETQRVENLTRPYWFTSEFQQLQDGNAILVLDPLIASQ